MSRLLTCGWDTGSPNEGNPTLTGSGWTASTTEKKEGAYSLRGNTGAGAATQYWNYATGAALDRTVYTRWWFRFPAAPAGATAIAGFSPSAGSLATNAGLLNLNTSRTVDVLWGGTIRGTSAALAVDTWHLIEFSVGLNTGSNDTLSCSINGVSIYSATGLNITDSVNHAFFILAAQGGAGANWIDYFDSLKINDSTGSDNTGQPGAGSLAYVVAASDGSIGSGWTGGAGGTSNIFGAVDNVPPVGVADTGTDASQIRNASSASASYVAVLQTYTAAGVGSIDTVEGIHGLGVVGAPVATQAKTGSLGFTSNPSNTALSFGNYHSGANAGTFPTGWKYVYATYINAPSVTKGTGASLSMNITGGTSTRIADVCEMGAYIEFTAGVAGSQVSFERLLRGIARGVMRGVRKMITEPLRGLKGAIA